MELLNMHVLLSYKLQEANIELVLTLSILVLWVVYDMGDSGNNKSSHKMSRSEMESFSLDASRFSRDFLTRFMGSNSSSGGSREAQKFGHYNDDNDDDDELNLGLSLGGRFGVDKSSKNNKLIRSSSIAACLPVVRDDNDAVSASASAVQPVAFSSLVRTSSLPVETEEEWRKRKELQSLRRMEAKRRRSEKQRKAERESLVSSTTVGEEEKKDTTESNLRREQQCLAAAKRFSSSVTALPAAGRQSIVGGGIDAAMTKGKGSILGTNLLGQLLFSQGSVESQGGSFSSELESTKSLQGSNSSSDPSPGSIQSSQKGNEQDIGSSSRTKTKEESGRTTSLAEVENPSKKSDATNRGKESKKNTLEEMPCVFTKGDGPNGRRVDGILYKYGKGEEVRIMCVCHGNFLSPAEFIKHAGGTDVAHPLKHIVVNPNASPFP